MESELITIELKPDEFQVLISDLEQQLIGNCRENEVINNAEDILNTLGNYGIVIKGDE